MDGPRRGRNCWKSVLHVWTGYIRFDLGFWFVERGGNRLLLSLLTWLPSSQGRGRSGWSSRGVSLCGLCTVCLLPLRLLLLPFGHGGCIGLRGLSFAVRSCFRLRFSLLCVCQGKTRRGDERWDIGRSRRDRGSILQQFSLLRLPSLESSRYGNRLWYNL